MLLAIDGALRLSGYAIFDNKKVIKVGTWQTKSTDELSDRLDTILLEIERLCKEYPIDRIAFEDVQEQSRNVLTYRRLVSVSTSIEYWCHFSKVKWVRISASHWRKVLTGKYGIKFGRKRADQKKAMTEFAKEYTGIDDITEDESDAVGIGLASIINNEFEDKYAESAF